MLNIHFNLRKFSSFLVLLIFLGFLIFSLVHLSDYGPNWDEPAHFGRGYAILYFFLTGRKNYQNLPTDTSLRRSFYQNEAYSFEYFEKNYAEKTGTSQLMIGGGHPPLSDILAAFFNLVFYQKLGVLGDVEAFHFYGVFLASILLALIFYFTQRQYGFFAGFIATLSLAIYPLFLGECRFNIKDVPETVFYSLTILSFYQGVTSNKIRWIFLSSLFFGFALGTKLNIVFVPFIFLPWLIAIGLNSLVKKKKVIFSALILYPVLGISIFFASWPFLWPAPADYLSDVLRYYKNIGTTVAFDPRFLTIFRLNTYAIRWILYTAPVVILFFSLLGTIYILRRGLKEKYKTSLLILFWFLIPILRVTIPKASIYGGLRQIMEFIPAMAILSGIGANWIRQKFSHRSIVSLIIILSFLPLTIKLISIHPNESIYFNFLIGGLKGAKERNLPGWGNSLGSTYRQGVKWLNEHAEKGARVALIYELKSNIPQADLRSDIIYDNHVRSAIKKEGEYVIGVTHQGTAENSYHRKYLERFLEPVYEVKIDSVAVLKIWKNDLEHTKPEYQKPEGKFTNFSLVKEQKFILIDFGKKIKLTKVELRFPTLFCTLPTDGYFEISANGYQYERLPGDFQIFPLASWFTTQPEKGKLQFLFAADETRFIKIVTDDKNSCLLLKPVNLNVWRI